MVQCKHFDLRGGGAVVVFPELDAEGRKIWLTEDIGERWVGELGSRWEVVGIQCGQRTNTMSIEITTETQ